jgi:hypothetical protein
MSMSQDPVDALARAEDASIVHVTQSAMSAIVRSEVEAQLDAAHKYKRSITRFLQDAKQMATLSVEIAESCMYSLPRAGKALMGPSVRLAEICASAYGNLQVGARVMDAEEKEVVAQGAAWDMERNLRATIEVRRRITDRSGKRFNDDMITVTGAAASSIALRNAIFRVIPRAYVDTIYAAAKRVATGDGMPFAQRRDEVLARLQKMGATQPRVLARLGRTGVNDVTVEDLEQLIGFGTAIKGGDTNVDEVFPEPSAAPLPAAQDGKRISLKGGKKPDGAAPTNITADGEVLPEGAPNPDPAPAPAAAAPVLSEAQQLAAEAAADEAAHAKK